MQKVAHMPGADSSALDLSEHQIRREGRRRLQQRAAPVHSPVAGFAFVGQEAKDSGHRPCLEVERFFRREFRRAVHIGGDAVCLDLHIGEAARFDEVYGEGGDVYADPPAVEVVGGSNGGSAAAEGVEDDAARIGTCLDDALHQGEGLLRRIAGAFGVAGGEVGDVRPDVADGRAFVLVGVEFVARAAIRRPVDDAGVCGDAPVERLLRPTPTERAGDFAPVYGSRFSRARSVGGLLQSDVLESPAGFGLRVREPLGQFIVSRYGVDFIEFHARAVGGVEEDDVGHVVEASLGEAMHGVALPRDFVHKVGRAEHGVHQRLKVVAGGGVAVEVDAARRLEEAFHRGEPQSHIAEVGQHAGLAEHFAQSGDGFAGGVGRRPAEVAHAGRRFLVPLPRVLEGADLRRRPSAGSDRSIKDVVVRVGVERRVEVD